MATPYNFKLPGMTLSDLPDFRSVKYTISLLLVSFGVVWRSQVSSLAGQMRLGPQQIQKLDSSRFIAGPYLTHPNACFFFGLVAFSKALLFVPIPKSEEELLETYESGATEVIFSKGPSKILPLNSLTAPNILSHRRGLKGQIVGKFQCDPIYSPSTISSSVPPGIVTFSSFWSGFVSICGKLNWTMDSVVSHLVEFLREIPPGSSCLTLCFMDSPPINELLNQSLSNQLAFAPALGLAVIHHHIISCSPPLEFGDGLIMSPNSSPVENLTPLEKDIQADLSRSLPNTAIPVEANPANPFSAEFIRQTKAFNAAVGGAPKNTPKPSAPPAVQKKKSS